jgi:lysozyme
MISEKGIKLLKDFEGFRTHAYQDSVGVWTIGYGHTKGVTPNMIISTAEGEEMLVEELKEYENYVDDLVKVPLDQHQYDALVSWVYNLGPTNFRSSTMLRVLNEGKYEEVPNQIRRWNKAGGKELDGLTRRRNAEAEMFAGK